MTNLIILFSMLSSFSSYASADSTFGVEAKKCLKLLKGAEKQCDKKGSCPPQVVEPAIQCLKKLGVANAFCQVKSNRFRCESKSNIGFSDAEGCRLVIAPDPDGDWIYVGPDHNDKSKSCVTQEYEIDRTTGSVSVVHAKRGKDKKWVVPPIRLPIGLEKIISPASIEEIFFLEPENAPWNPKSENYCGSNPIQPTDFRSNEKVQELRKKYGFSGREDGFAERHFVGRNGPKHFLAIRSFKLKSDIKLCGKIIPSGTLLHIDAQASCRAATDGAIEISNIPVGVFPELAPEANKYKLNRAYCAPKALYLSDFIRTLLPDESRKGSAEVPKLDWQSCDCRVQELHEGEG